MDGAGGHSAHDWMKDIEQDTRAMQELVRRIEQLHMKLLVAIRDNNKRSSLLIVGDCIEGMQLFKQLAGIQ